MTKASFEGLGTRLQKGSPGSVSMASHPKNTGLYITYPYGVYSPMTLVLAGGQEGSFAIYSAAKNRPTLENRQKIRPLQAY